MSDHPMTPELLDPLKLYGELQDAQAEVKRLSARNRELEDRIDSVLMTQVPLTESSGTMVAVSASELEQAAMALRGSQ